MQWVGGGGWGGLAAGGGGGMRERGRTDCGGGRAPTQGGRLPSPANHLTPHRVGPHVHNVIFLLAATHTAHGSIAPSSARQGE